MSDIKKGGFDLTDTVMKAMNGTAIDGIEPKAKGPPSDAAKLILFQLDVTWPSEANRVIEVDMLPGPFAGMYAIMAPARIIGGDLSLIIRIIFHVDPDQTPTSRRFVMLQMRQLIASDRRGAPPRHLATIGNPTNGAPVSLFETDPVIEIEKATTADAGPQPEH